MLQEDTIIDTVHLISSAEYVAGALQLIRARDIITLDESAASIELVGQLPHCAHLTVVTNGLITASLLTHRTDITVVLLPGQLDRPSRSVITAPLLPTLPYRSDHAFFGATAYTPEAGLMERSSDLARTKNLLIRDSRRTTAAITTDAVGQFGPYVFATTDDITSLHIIGPLPASPPGRPVREAAKLAH